MGRYGRFEPFQTQIADFEYGVTRDAIYESCAECGLIAQRPPVPADEIASLYPEDYQAYQRPKQSLFAIAKNWLVKRDARTLIAATDAPKPVILEIGCGNGVLLEAVHRLCPDSKVVGVDIKDLGLSSHEFIEFHEGQLEEVSLEKDTFDAIYFSNLIEHVVNPFEFLERVGQLLRPGGIAILITPNHRSLDRFIFGRFWGGYHFPRHLYIFDNDTIHDTVTSAGLECLSIKGSYAWWYISIANRLYKDSARRKRGLAFAVISAAFLPLDLLINIFRYHGSMKVIFRRPESEGA